MGDEALLELAVVDARHGRMSYFAGDDPIGKSLAMYGEWAEAELELLRSFIGLGSAVVDVGANVGTHTLAFSRRVGTRGSVRAFEPQRAVFDVLERNLTANGCANVVAVRAGVGRAAGEMFVPAIDYRGQVNVGGLALVGTDAAAHGMERTPIVALDDLALEVCHLAKVDTEGMEQDVLAGMAGTIRRLRPVIYLECDTVDAGVAVLSAIEWPGYRFFLVRTAAYHPSNHKGNADNFFGVARESSLLCMPDEARDLVPRSGPGAEVLPVANLQRLAEGLLATPRYGDATLYDRDAAKLRLELEAVREAIREAAEARGRLEFRAASLARQLEQAEERLAAAATELAAARTMAEKLREAQAALADRDRQIAALRASTSWRVTAPLRRVKIAFDSRRAAKAPRR